MIIPNWKRLSSDTAFRERMVMRSAIISAMREFFVSRGFLEVETPVLARLPGMEPHLDPFETEVRRCDGTAFKAHLITSPEYAMKKLLAAGFDKIFEITKCFRNSESWYGGHNPEFTMIEWYRAGADYAAIMKDVEEMVYFASQRTKNAPKQSKLDTWQAKRKTQNIRMDFMPPWPRMTVAEAFDRYCGLDLGEAIDDLEWFRKQAAERGIPAGGNSFDEIFFKLFLRDIEPNIGAEKPVILYDYPRQMAALARLKPSDQRFAERFEVYCQGLELCNAFSELIDADEQRRRLESEREERRQLGKTSYDIDEDFLDAVGHLPECAGIALGADRLVMLLTDCRDISDVLFFPAVDLFSESAADFNPKPKIKLQTQNNGQ